MAPWETPSASSISHMDAYVFDLQGYVVVRGALSTAELAIFNEQIDANNPAHGRQPDGGIPAAEARAMMADPDSFEGKDRQVGFGDGVPTLGTHPCFDALIAHAGWIEHIRTFMDSPAFRGASCIIRWPGQASRLHSGGHTGSLATQFKYLNGEFHCGAINVMVALNDCPLGGGGTAIVPGSHKSSIAHPAYAPGGTPQRGWKDRQNPRNGQTSGGFMDGAVNAVEVALEAGDALIFVDSAVHGSTCRTLPGSRRTMILNYGPDLGSAWQPSPELAERLPAAALEWVAAPPAKL
eukprot:COSAG06_NODE_6947_length_2702_cov_1.797235_2_plen_294_part_00